MTYDKNALRNISTITNLKHKQTAANILVDTEH